MEEIYDEYSYKIIFLGWCGTGAKTSLISQFAYNKFDANFPSSLGASLSSLLIQTELGTIMLDLWDTPGQLFYRALNKHFIKDSHCAILGYDIAREDSFSEIKEYGNRLCKRKKY